MGEEDLHRLFNGLARDFEENKVIFEKDLTKKLPNQLVERMSQGKMKSQSKVDSKSELKFSVEQKYNSK